jgi:hypothetical protein
MVAQAQEKTLWAMTFYDQNDSMLLADFYSSIDPTADLQKHVFYVQAKAGTSRAEFWLQPGADQTAYLRQVRITPAQGSDEILQWQDSIYRSVPPSTTSLSPTAGSTCPARCRTQSNAAYEYYLRDPLHANARGRQVLARMLAAYFEPKDASSK